MGCCRLLLGWLAIGTIVSALMAGEVSAYMPQLPAPGPTPFNLGEDDAYRREGTLTDMNTCLAVADDEAVTQLLSHREVRGALGRAAFDRANMLRDMSLFMKRRAGYGTLLACAEIVAAWHSRSFAIGRRGGLSAANPPLAKQDGRIEHGALVIDLKVDEANRALIGSVPLARLLTSPGVLPPSAYGGIVVKNAEIDSPLILHNLHITTPIAFIGVTFSGGSISQAMYNIQERTPITALVISSSRLDHRLIFAESNLCGGVVIRDSHFRERLSFRKVDQRDIGCDHQPDIDSTSTLSIEDSQFDQALSMVRSRFAAATIAGIQAEKLDADRVDFGRSLLIEENTLGGLQLDCGAFADRTDIVRNQVAQVMRLEGFDDRPAGSTADRRCRTWWEVTSWQGSDRRSAIRVANNRIEGGLFLQYLDGKQIASPLRLASNHVAGHSLIMMPRPTPDARVWDGDINLQGSHYDGVLELKSSPWPRRRFARSRADDRYCTAISNDNPLRGISIELRASHVRTLLWNLPLTCDHRWLGYGLTYDLWLKGGHALNSLGDVAFDNYSQLDHLALEAWRQTLLRHDSPSINAMSTYFAEKGEYVVSREILLEAKRLNYVPNCAPDQWMLACAATVGRELAKSVVTLFSEPERPDGRNHMNQAAMGGLGTLIGDRLLDALSWLWRLAMLILLWPGGYGAQPERAFLLLIAAFAICWMIYRHYTRGMRDELLHEWAPIDRFLAENADRIARTNRSVERPAGLAEAQKTFDFEHLLPPNGDQAWISEESWRRKMGDDERLREIQGPLLARVSAWEEMASDEDAQVFQEFRERLERFGNTETAGFGRFDGNKMPKRFTERLYSFDTMLPVIDLHAYSNYYPIKGWVRVVSLAQHVCGWWWISVFIASAAIL